MYGHVEFELCVDTPAKVPNVVSDECRDALVTMLYVEMIVVALNLGFHMFVAYRSRVRAYSLESRKCRMVRD